jgi:phosphoglucomutase
MNHHEPSKTSIMTTLNQHRTNIAPPTEANPSHFLASHGAQFFAHSHRRVHSKPPKQTNKKAAMKKKVPQTMKKNANERSIVLPSRSLARSQFSIAIYF